jgi:peptidyl-prolyl cis-trans isomerase SurA
VKAIFKASGLAAFLLLASLWSSASVFGQEGEPVVIDEVVAQVNSDVITLSMVKRELKEAIEALKSQGASEQQATDEINRRRPELIASLINEQLLLQKGKDMNLTEEVEKEVNRRMLQVATEQGIKTLTDLDEAMRSSGVDPVMIRQRLRAEIMKEMVLTEEVDRRVYLGLSTSELQQYFNTHQDKFKRPETVTLSEIWLSLAGKNEAEVKAKAQQLVQQARAAGADFSALAISNSEREQNGVRITAQTKGRVGTFQVPDLRADIAGAIKGVPAGGISEPLRSNEGYQILRVDERNAGDAKATFVENKVREMITVERREKERGEYIKNLRRDAYIKIAETYRPMLEPLLNTTTAAQTTTTTGKSATDGNKKP